MRGIHTEIYTEGERVERARERGRAKVGRIEEDRRGRRGQKGIRSGRSGIKKGSEDDGEWRVEGDADGNRTRGSE